jgi:hypothetical protein
MRVLYNAINTMAKMADLMKEAKALDLEITALGGISDTDIVNYWKDENGDDRTDREITYTEFSAIFTTNAEFLTRIANTGHKTNVYNAIRNRG